MYRAVLIVATLAAGFLSATTLAGPLTPPAGPVASTHKTLTEVEPRTPISAANTPGDADSTFRITAPGSYYLTGDTAITEAGKGGIEIAASHVTIDLMGFRLSGVAGTLNGIALSGNQTNITIRNGTVTGFGAFGIRLFVSTATGALVEGIHASANGQAGIQSGVGCIVRSCTATSNTFDGFSMLAGSVAIQCTAVSNGSDGISAGNPGAVVIECVARVNGDDGITVGQGSLVERCFAFQNTGNGIACFTGSTVRGNSCWSNGNSGDGAGIFVTGNDSRIEGNNCTASDRGIDVDGSGNIIIRNTCSGNTTNWDIATGNAVAPIVQATTNPAAISGNTYAGSLGSTDPNANFTY